MPKLTYMPENFRRFMGPTFLMKGQIAFSWSELCRAAITVGRRNWRDVFKHGTYSALEIMWRFAMVRANLVESDDGFLRKSTAFTALDRSEKGTVSFFFGMCFSKLIAEKLFAVPWLLHLDVYKDDLNPEFATKNRPDFVGMDATGNWLIMEAKGRTGQIPKDLLRKAKRQTQSLRKINGILPSLRVVVGSYFSSGALKLRVRDPEEFSKSAIDLEIDPESLARSYYKPIIDCFKLISPNSEPSNIDNYRSIALPGIDVEIRIDNAIYSWYQKNEPTWSQLIESKIVESRIYERSTLEEIELRKRLSEGGEPEAFITDPIRIAEESMRLTEIKDEGLDGIYIKLGESWNEKTMKMEPHKRGSEFGV
jgi:hypothetical protein